MVVVREATEARALDVHLVLLLLREHECVVLEEGRTVSFQDVLTAFAQTAEVGRQGCCLRGEDVHQRKRKEQGLGWRRVPV